MFLIEANLYVCKRIIVFGTWIFVFLDIGSLIFVPDMLSLIHRNNANYENKAYW